MKKEIIGTAAFKTRVLRSFFWLGTGTFTGQLISWISTIVVIRLLSPSDYGLMAMASTYISLLTTVSTLGFSTSIIQAEQIEEEEIRKIYGFIIISAFTGFILSYLIAPRIAAFFEEDRLTTLIRFLSINFIIISLYTIPEALFIREMNFKKKAQLDVLVQVGTSAVTVILALNGLGVWALVAGTIAFHSFKAAGFNMARSLLRPSFNFRGLGKFIKYGLTVVSTSLVYYLYTQSDKIIIGKFLGKTLLGLYGVALNLASVPLEKVLPLITQVSFTSYSRIQNDVERIRRNLLRATRIVAFVGFPLFLGMALIAPEAITLILGHKWESLIVPFQLLCIILPIKALIPLLAPPVFAIGKPKVDLVSNTITVIVMTIAFLIGVRGGLFGVCLAWIIAFPIVCFVTLLFYLKVLDLSLKHYLSELKFPFFAGVLMSIFIVLLKKITLVFHPWCALIILVLSGIAVYMGLALAFRRDEYLELKGLLLK